MKNKASPILAIATALVLSVTATSHTAVIIGNAADAQIGIISASSNPTLPTDGGATEFSPAATTGRVGTSNTFFGDAVFVFQLPNLGAISNPFSAASLTFNITGIAPLETAGSM